jgi:hypothetical protein
MALVAIVTVVAVGAALVFVPAHLPVAVGGADCPTALPAGEWTVKVLPLDTVQPGDFVTVSWDVCGLSRGMATTTSVVMRSANPRLAARAGGTSRIDYRDTLSSDAVRRTRRVKLPAVTPGPYLLTIAVRPDKGKARTATTPLRVEWTKR